MSENKTFASKPQPTVSGLQMDKSTGTNKKICYYLELPETEKIEHLKPSLNQNRLDKVEAKIQTQKTVSSQLCVLDSRQICQKNCYSGREQKEEIGICRNQCKLDEKKLCIQFDQKKDFAQTLSVKIYQRPWESRQNCVAQTYQCYCNELIKLKEEAKLTQKLNRTGLSDGKPLHYQDDLKLKFYQTSKFKTSAFQPFELVENLLTDQFLKTFQIESQFSFSPQAHNLLLSFKNKYIYYAIDDILYLLNSNPIEQDNLIAILYSCMLSLQNDFSVNFFDIWIDSVYWNETISTNRFLTKAQSCRKSKNQTIITIKLHYFLRIPVKKSEPIW